MTEQEQPDRPSGDERDIPKPAESGQTMKNGKPQEIERRKEARRRKRKPFQLPPRPQKNP